MTAHPASSGSHPAAAPPHRAAGAKVIKIPPPLYFVAAYFAGRGINTAVEWNIDHPTASWAGAGLLVAGAALAAAGVAGVAHHRTTIVPHREVTTLVRSGAYSVSRNPMYAGLTVAYVGLTLATHSWWPLATLPAAIAAVRWLVIAPEETYLAQRYPAEFADYRARVRRWL